ncbi:DUF5337 domain-containing protein [Psychromarinibacter sp. C21-152]|uniref:DUF5337 domain-containing protein n=1 Tax=Psychromarinibacter sediminicola TaxID=3033385 RepID=A0AAE3NMY7_9RHOB|nr:DUF5337 domain-containing protein [Psychromarinibacter sediminicola]MDF0599226.1 DUF5337 domain-containing protein [Psychromarinibacter sediminicola]
MAEPGDKDKALARQARQVAVVIVATLVLWLGAQYAGAALGLTPRVVLLFDFLALAGFLWAIIVTYQIWRKRRDNEG